MARSACFILQIAGRVPDTQSSPMGRARQGPAQVLGRDDHLRHGLPVVGHHVHVAAQRLLAVERQRGRGRLGGRSDASRGRQHFTTVVLFGQRSHHQSGRRHPPTRRQHAHLAHVQRLVPSAKSARPASRSGRARGQSSAAGGVGGAGGFCADSSRTGRSCDVAQFHFGLGCAHQSEFGRIVERHRRRIGANKRNASGQPFEMQSIAGGRHDFDRQPFASRLARQLPRLPPTLVALRQHGR